MKIVIEIPSTQEYVTSAQLGNALAQIREAEQELRAELKNSIQALLTKVMIADQVEVAQYTTRVVRTQSYVVNYSTLSHIWEVDSISEREPLDKVPLLVLVEAQRELEQLLLRKLMR